MIIDASIAFKWLFPEEGADEAREWISRAELIAPTLLHAEIGNAIWKRAHRGEVAASGIEIAEQLKKLAAIVRTVDETPLLPRAVEMAVELGHPVYDCVYLAVAESLDDELLTADERFVRAVGASELAARMRFL